jgi:4-diphosphocytidyl-2-C-methyl-D-erythritol kinase
MAILKCNCRIAERRRILFDILWIFGIIKHLNMDKPISIFAPAKINLHLEVLNKRADGYHNLISIVQLISLYDEIVIRSLKKSGECRIFGTDTIALRKNTIWKAVTAFREKTGIDSGLEISLNKNIPQGAGLGGGSSDAAYTLMGINALFGNSLTIQELMNIAVKVGADVPLFLSVPAGIMTGMGEKIELLSPRDDFTVVVVFPGQASSTPEAYASLERTVNHGEYKFTPEDAKNEYLHKKPCNWKFINSFEEKNYDSREIIDDIRRCGFCFCRMTGSGSSCFGLLPKEEAKKGMPNIDFLKAKYSFVWVAEPLTGMPKVII